MPSTAPTPDAPLPYLLRIHDYYLALGYGAPYVWATFAEVPFQRLRKPLAECRIALVTTAAPFKPGAGDQGPGAPYNALAKFYRVYSGAAGDEGPLPDLRIAHVAIAPRSTGVSPQRWHPDNNDWKLDYCNIDRLSAAQIARRRAEFDTGKAQAKALRTHE